MIKATKEKTTVIKRKYGFVTESKKLLDKLPQYMRFVGKPEVLSESFFDKKLRSTDENLVQGNTLTKEEMQSMILEALVLEPSEIRVGLFAIKIDKISKNEFKMLRKVFPFNEYTLVKNRLKAR